MGLVDVILGFFYRMLGYRKVTADSFLRTNGGSPVAGGQVTLSYRAKSKTAWTRDGTGVTDPTGFAAENVYLKRGRYDFKVNFPGKPGYGPSSAEVDNFPVF